MSFNTQKTLFENEMMNYTAAVFGKLLNPVKRLSITRKKRPVVQKTACIIECDSTALHSEKALDFIVREIEKENQRASEAHLTDVDIASEYAASIQKMMMIKPRETLQTHVGLIKPAVLRLLG